MTINLTPDVGKNFCYAPWTNIHINPQGSYKTCCAGKTEIGNLRDESMDVALQNPKLSEIKTALLNNKVHPNCEICINVERHTTASERVWYNNIAENKVIPIVDIDNQQIQNLDIRWNNTCNLSCVYCGTEASSTWSQLKNSPKERTDYGPNLSNIMDHINQYRSTIKNLALLGGEPLLQKENEALLDVVDDNVNINVITNLSVPLERNKIFNRLIEMNNVIWDISFETVENKFEYVRHGASWDLMLKNIDILKSVSKDNPGQRVNVTGQYCVYNCLNLSELYEAFLDYNLPPLRLNELIQPTELSVFSLPNHLLEICAQEVNKSIKYVENYTTPVQKRFLEQQAVNLRNTNNPNATVDKLYIFHQIQEKTYWPKSQLKFAELWPEFKTL